MKFLERLSLKLFSIIVFVTSIVLILMVCGIVNPQIVPYMVSKLTDGDVAIRTTVVISGILILLALKSFFSKLKPVDEAKNGIILENANGKLVISKESLENLIAGVSKSIPGAESVSSKTLVDKDKNLRVYVSATVSSDIMLKEISVELQRKIKEAMKKTADLDVKEVNIKIKNITNKKVKSKDEKKQEDKKLNENLPTEENESKGNISEENVNQENTNGEE
jgi:uncharacterized alkaline shock family protein YloU